MSDEVPQGVIAPSAAAAQAEQDRRRGPNMRLKQGRQYRLRLCPAFKLSGGQGVWFSVRRKHWKVPVPDTGDYKTFACTQELGQPCYVCDMAKELNQVLPQMAKNLKPNLAYMFNVIDVDNPNFGIQQLEDGATLFNLFLGIVQALPTIADPVQGQIITVSKLPQAPWRTAIPGPVLSYDEIGIPIDAAYPANLKNLDDVWEYIPYEEQKTLFQSIKHNPHQFMEGSPQGQLPATPTPVTGFPINDQAVEMPPGSYSSAPVPAAPAVTVPPPAPVGQPPAMVTPAAPPQAAPAPAQPQAAPAQPEAAPAQPEAAADIQARLEAAAAAAGSS